MILILLLIAGFIVSLYGFFIEQKIKRDPEYTPICDISDRVSCTKPIKSSMGKLFGISNTIVGMAFYAIMTVFSLLGLYYILFVGAIGACIVSLYLAYILYFRIKTLCLICIITYMINFALLVLSGMAVLYY